MSKKVVEYAGIPVGIVVTKRSTFRFIAVKFHVYERNDRYFPSIASLQAAIRDLMVTDKHQLQFNEVLQ